MRYSHYSYIYERKVYEMTIEQLRYCIEADKYRSFSKAADALYVSPSNVSMSVSNLEHELGLQLFKRTSKGVIATIHGITIISYAKEVLKNLNKIELYAENHGDSINVEIKIGSAPLFSFSFLRDFLIQIFTICPEIKVKSESLTNQEIINSIYLQKLQFGLIGFTSRREKAIKEELERREIEYTPLYSSKIYCFMNPEHPLVNKEVVDLQHLSAYPVVIHEHSCTDLKPLLEKSECNITETNDYEIIKSLAMQPYIVSLAPYLSEKQFKDAGLIRKEQNFFSEYAMYFYIRDRSVVNGKIDYIVQDILRDLI